MRTAGFDTIIEGEEADLPMNYRGDPSSFKDSPMASLLEEYTGETNSDELSTETLVTLLVTLDDLEPDNIERIENPNRSLTKYKLATEFLENLTRTTVELQLFVERAAGLLEERETHFVVDPGDTLLHILKGTTSLPQLNVAWKAIQKRLELGHHTLQKYQQQYQLSPQEGLLLSPISTTLDLHNELHNLPSADQRLLFLYQKFPHHRGQTTGDSESALAQGRSWTNIFPLPSALKNILAPEREPHEEKEDTRNAKGKQKEKKDNADHDEMEPDPPERIWLGAETPFKGPNKWFGGGRLKMRGSLTGQTIVGPSKSNQNVLFGLATPQLPIWATDSVDPPASPKQPRANRALERTSRWANHDTPPHLPATASTSQPRNANTVKKGTGGGPPDDDDDEEGDPPNRGRGHRRDSHKGSSSSRPSSQRGNRRGGVTGIGDPILSLC